MVTTKKIWLIFSSGERLWLFILMAILLATSLLELVGLALVIPYVNLMLLEESYKEYSEISPLLNWMLSLSGNYRLDATLWFAGFYILKNALLTILTFCQHTIIKKLHANVISRVYCNIMSKPYDFHIKSNTSDILRTMTYDTMHFGDGVLSQSGILIAELFLFIGIIVILALHSMEALLIIFVLVVALALMLSLIKKKLQRWSKMLQEKEASIIRQVQEGFGGIKDVLVCGSTAFFERKFRKNIYLRSRIKRNRDVILILPRFVIEALMMVGMASVLFWLSSSSSIEENFSLIAFLAVVLVRMLPMSTRIMNSLTTINSCIPSTNVIFEYTRDIKNEIKNNLILENKHKNKSFKSIDFKNLHFSYNPDEALLEGVNFSINEGDILGIVGSSGSGKTTLVDILLGLLKPQSGQVLLDGELNIHEHNDIWQPRVGYVAQTIFLVDDTIKANIAFGLEPNAVDEYDINKALRLAKLDKWVATLPDGVNSAVGERGVSISGGQRQRIGIARALYRQPEILILDEATSNLDNLTEKELIEDILSMAHTQTIVMIAHRLNTIKKCNRIIVLDQGKIAGSGTYNELIANNQIFQKISVSKNKNQMN